jgi:uncharacterized protein (TIGR00369 family)
MTHSKSFELPISTDSNTNKLSKLAQWEAELALARGNLSQSGTTAASIVAQYDGLTFLEKMSSGEFAYPPICDALNFYPIHVEHGRIVFQGTSRFEHYNPIGSVHGGWFCGILDSAVACAVHSALPKGKAYTTVEFKINILRPLTDKTGPVRAEGKIIHVGNRTGVAEGRIYDTEGKLYAYASTTCMIFEIPPE